MRLFAQLLVALVFLTPKPCFGQTDAVTRKFVLGCDQVISTAKTYLQGRGFTETDSDLVVRSSRILLDAKGNRIATSRIRSQLAAPQPLFFVWSTPLHASTFMQPTPERGGCTLRLTITSHSMHPEIVGIFPGTEPLGFGSNGKLESEYLEAIGNLMAITVWVP